MAAGVDLSHLLGTFEDLRRPSASFGVSLSFGGPLVNGCGVTSLKLLGCKNGGFQKLSMNLCAHEIK
jgi:hypothetical protein